MDNIFDKLGGRKFSMGIVLIVAGACVDIFSPNGLSVNLLGLMTAIYAAFSASNTMVTNKQLEVEKVAAANPPPAPAGPDLDVQALSNDLVPVMTRIGNALTDIYAQQAAQGEALSTQAQALSAIISMVKR